MFNQALNSFREKFKYFTHADFLNVQWFALLSCLGLKTVYIYTIDLPNSVPICQIKRIYLLCFSNPYRLQSQVTWMVTLIMNLVTNNCLMAV